VKVRGLASRDIANALAITFAVATELRMPQDLGSGWNENERRLARFSNYDPIAASAPFNAKKEHDPYAGLS
jgi:hypothetical protein